MSDLKNKTAQGLAWGGFFSVIQQLTGLILGIVIARILDPSDYGMVGMLSIFIAFASILQESGFVFVLTNRKGIDKGEYSTIFWFNVLMSFTLYIVFFFSAPLLGVFFKNEQIVPLSRYVFLGFFISSFGVIQSAVLFKRMQVKERGIATFVGSITAGIFGVILAKNGFAYWGLATQGLVSTTLSTALLWFYSPFRPSCFFDTKFLRSVLPDGIRFAVPNIVSTISGNIYSVLLGRYYTISDVGYFNQATKFNTYGYSLTLGMLRNVSQPMFVQIQNDHGGVLNAFRKLVRFTAFVSFPSMLVLSFVAPELIYVFLSPKWLYAAYILKIIGIGGAFTALNTLFTYYIISQKQSSLYMWLGVCNSILRIFLAVIASFWGVMSLAYVCATYDVLIIIVYYGITKKSLDYSLKMLASDILPLLSISILIIVFIHFVTIGIVNIYLLLFLKITIFIVLFLLSMYLIHFDIYLDAIDIIKRKINNW